MVPQDPEFRLRLLHRQQDKPRKREEGGDRSLQGPSRPVPSPLSLFMFIHPFIHPDPLRSIPDLHHRSSSANDWMSSESGSLLTHRTVSRERGISETTSARPWRRITRTSSSV